ncbi:efflux RND transporter periplasmic adaptor subunit [Actibacterium sp. D379-3]
MSERQDSIQKTLQVGKHRRKVPGWAKAVAVLAVAALAVWFFVLRGDQAGGVSYQTEAVQRSDLSVTVSATGTVEPTNLVEISSELSGTLAEVDVDFNDTVEVGQVLAQLDTTKLEAQAEVQRANLVAAEARVEQAQVSFQEAYDNFISSEQLEARGITPHLTFVATRAAYERSVAALQIADADRALAQANLDLIHADLAKAVIQSPIKGTILDLDADPGQIVASSLSAPILFTIAEDLASMELQVDVDEADIGMVAVGNMAEFTVEAYDNEVFPAQITEVRYASETVDGVVTYKAILMIDNTDLRLRPGMTATADITVTDVADALLVPNTALRFAPPQVVEKDDSASSSGLVGLIMPSRPGSRSGGNGVNAGKTVWVLKDGQAQKVEVQVGLSDGSYTAIVGGDLAEGDLVITDQTEAK